MVGMRAISTAVTKWTARLLSGAILLFWGSFLVAQLMGTEAIASRPLVYSDYLLLITVVVAIGGLALAWKWELAGASTTLIAITLCAGINLKVLVFPGTLIPITGALFLLAWWLRRPSVAAPVGRPNA